MPRCAAGRLSARATDLIAAAASDDPAVERQLIAAAAKGYVPLRDRCIAVRAAREDQAERAKRQHAARSFRMWPTPDGMVEGHFKVTPEVGGAIEAVDGHGTREEVPRGTEGAGAGAAGRYAADAFADAIVGGPSTSKGGGWYTRT